MPIRVLLADMSPMLRDIIHDAVANQPDLEVVGTLGVHEPFLSVIENIPTDVLILGTSQRNDVALAEAVWHKRPRTRVLMITHDGRGAVLHRLHPEKVVLGDVSSESLVAAIRRTLAW
jgi:DNA-binding NarL/FixJ family response regulator